MNVAFVTADGILKHPKFDHILSGCTSLRLLELAATLQTRGLVSGIQVCEIRVLLEIAQRQRRPVLDNLARRQRPILLNRYVTPPVVPDLGLP